MSVVPIVQSYAVPTYDLMMTHHMLTQSMQFPDSILKVYFTLYTCACVSNTHQSAAVILT